MAIERVMVIGAGQMGGGIAQVMAQAGIDVTLRDVSDDLVQKGIGRIDKALAKLVEKGKLKADDKAATMARTRRMASCWCDSSGANRYGSLTTNTV